MITSLSIETHNNNVISSIELLSDSVNKYEGALMDYISELAKNRQTDQIHKTLVQADRVKNFSNNITDLKQKWIELVNNNADTKPFADDSGEDSNSREVTARTTWNISGDSVRIETERVDGPPYSNILPLPIFKEIATKAVSIADGKNFVKTSDVLKILSEKIINESDYKKTPRIPVYATFKVLVKENILRIDKNNSHKYLLAISNIKANLWIEKL